MVTNFKKIAINNLIRILGLFLKTRKDVWLIGMVDGGGSAFPANCWYLLKYLKTSHPEIKPIVIYVSDSIKEKCDELGVECAEANSIAALRAALIAGAYFITTDLHHDIPNYNPFKGLKIHLWHGVPLKKIYYSSEKLIRINRQYRLRYFIKKILFGFFPPEKYDAIVYTSENFKEIMGSAFKNRNLILTGQPRDDVFYQDVDRVQVLKFLEIDSTDTKIKIISYLPTFRDSDSRDNEYYLLQQCKLADAYLEENNIYIVQKNHSSKLTKSFREGRRIYLSEGIDTQTLLKVSDILITDYSSVFIDFLHLKRPIIFYPYDLEEYQSKDRELYFNYFDEVITPGPKVRNESELFEVIKNIISNEQEAKTQLGKSLDFYHKYHDGKNSKRVVEEIKCRLYQSN